MKYIFFLLLILSAPLAFAQDFQLLSPLPNQPSISAGVGGYLQYLFNLGLGIAIALSVIMIVIGGAQYLSTDAVFGKEEGKSKLTNALWGLLLALTSYLILFTINPEILNLNLTIENLKKVTPPTVPPPSTTAVCPTCISLRGIALCKSANSCQVDPALANKIRTLQEKTLGLNWQVTEAWPPTVTHQNPCHQNGTCVDINFTDGATATKITSFIEGAANAGLTADYEVATAAEREALLAAGVRPGVRIKIVPQITAPHFSVYNR